MRVLKPFVFAFAFGTVLTGDSGASARALPPTYDAIDHYDCVWGPDGPICTKTGVDCYETCFTGFCCYLPPKE